MRSSNDGVFGQAAGQRLVLFSRAERNRHRFPSAAEKPEKRGRSNDGLKALIGYERRMAGARTAPTHPARPAPEQ